jgi:hypothetical protein
MAPFLLAGINHILTAKRTPINGLLLAGFFLAPLAALVVNDPHAIQREAGVLVFAVLIATIGIETMWTASQRWQRVSAVCLLALMPLQFAYVYNDYFNHYRLRSAFWFGGNMAEAMETLIALEPPDSSRPIYLTNAIPNANWWWRLYVTKHRRPELAARTIYFDPLSPPNPQTTPPGTLALSTVDDDKEVTLTTAGQFQLVQIVRDTDGKAFFGIFRR